MTSSTYQEFMVSWAEDPNQVKPLFAALHTTLTALGAELVFNPRPGISYSLRAKHPLQQTRPLFVLVDVVDDDPKARWLSVCFYDCLLAMPQGQPEQGDLVPKGLFGEDARCFDVENPEGLGAYLQACIHSAWAKAAE